MAYPPLATDRDAARRLLCDVLYGPIPALATAHPNRLAGGLLEGGHWSVARLALPFGTDIHVLTASPPEPRGLIVGPNFYGNAALHEDPDIPLPKGPPYPDETDPVARNAQPHAYPLDKIVAAGYAVATFHAADAVPDRADLAPARLATIAPGLGAIGAWGWASACVAASLADGLPVVFTGHSRMGKAALCAGAMFDLASAVIPIQSGTGGAAPSRTSTGETVEQITLGFPFWFAPAYATFAGDPDQLPFDQHWALALCTPARVLLPNAEEDQWADPDGQAEMLRLAAPAFDHPDRNLAHIRAGDHRVTLADWDVILSWLEAHPLTPR